MGATIVSRVLPWANPEGTGFWDNPLLGSVAVGHTLCACRCRERRMRRNSGMFFGTNRKRAARILPIAWGCSRQQSCVRSRPAVCFCSNGRPGALRLALPRK